MDAAQFGAEMSRLDQNPSVASADAALDQLLSRSDLTEAQRGDALFLRASKRLDGRFNLPGAIKDLQAFALLQPGDPRASAAERRLIFAAAEIESAQARLAQLQNLPDWFDDKVLMGDFADAATRYRESGLTPNEAQLYLLQEGRYVCAAGHSDTAETVHKYGPLREDVEGAVWCDDPSLS
jgi:phage tail tape-measure protein